MAGFIFYKNDMINIKYFYIKKDEEGYNQLYCDLSVVRNNDRTGETIRNIKIIDASGETIYNDSITPIVTGYCGEHCDDVFRITVDTDVESYDSPMSEPVEKAVGRNSVLYDYTEKTESGYTYKINTMNMYNIYKTFMNFVDEICESGCCDPCESQCPNRFVDFLIRLKAFELSSFTSDDNLGYLYNLIASRAPKGPFKKNCGELENAMPPIVFPEPKKRKDDKKKKNCGCKDV